MFLRSIENTLDQPCSSRETWVLEIGLLRAFVHGDPADEERGEDGVVVVVSEDEHSTPFWLNGNMIYCGDS